MTAFDLARLYWVAAADCCYALVDLSDDLQLPDSANFFIAVGWACDEMALEF